MSTIRLALLLVLSLAAVGVHAARPRDRERDNEAAVANVNLGAGYLRQGRLDLAMERLQRALKQNPRLADAHSVIAIAYDQLGMLDEAEMHYKRATQLEPGNSASANAYAVFLCRQNRWPDAEPFFKRAAENPTYATPEVAFTNAGVCARSAGAADKAAEYFRSALARNPTFPDALTNMMEMSYEGGNFLQARAFVQRFLESQMPTAPVLLMCVNVETQLKNHEAADRCAAKLRSGFQGSPELAKLEEEQQRRDGR
ncbi:MAG TPA: type IV pilus biogenesis/stability protein PilW [Gammaproteobacteria bacterium]|jgi:type IV pilus assembly protein PilF|nr:type IV pilus biogenesis/stability protein PilW [Gammaproteobacteria bacterium]